MNFSNVRFALLVLLSFVVAVSACETYTSAVVVALVTVAVCVSRIITTGSVRVAPLHGGVL